MKFKRHLKYRLFKLIFKNYTKFLQILYIHKLNSNLISLIKKEVEIKTVSDIGSHRGDFSNFLSKYLDNKIWCGHVQDGSYQR